MYYPKRSYIGASLQVVWNSSNLPSGQLASYGIDLMSYPTPGFSLQPVPSVLFQASFFTWFPRVGRPYRLKALAGRMAC